MAAFCNAIYAATGKRIRELPIKNQLSGNSVAKGLKDSKSRRRISDAGEKSDVELNSSAANTYGETLPKKMECACDLRVDGCACLAACWFRDRGGSGVGERKRSRASTFEEHCATCHAPNGSGDTVVGKSMKIPDLRSPAVQSQPDTQLADVIANGKALMPGFKSSLSKDEIDALVKHVHLLAGKKAVSQ